MAVRGAAVAELAGCWAALTGLWVVLISAVDALEWGVGAAAALLAAFAARAARRAARPDAPVPDGRFW
ncbi:hypothetical protein [Streptomyces sp. MST-110588]|uniref:hypothetical protein n=1 Tax=Streptomyces sp. MST-110588 TaxID=2833628 RepID=UPI001F5D8A91|nr:hypothetical protein [Streptomyces sp. MST-110588]UNO43665.1 hypothetical protein KGS77_03210 [Streptomyces sp. MST-110588]